ncbi:MAG: flagellar protein FlaG [Gammaproteobacteria bacterium]|nr:flagellar protein FlaG [Gammaproteobacteria bacterium]
MNILTNSPLQVAPVARISSSSENAAENKTVSGVNHQEQINKSIVAEQTDGEKTVQQLQDEKEQKIADEKEEEAQQKELNAAVTDFNSSIQGIQRNLAFSIDKDLGQIVVNVTDKKTDETIRQIPSEEFLELARNLQGMLDSKDMAHSGKMSEAVIINTKA